MGSIFGSHQKDGPERRQQACALSPSWIGAAIVLVGLLHGSVYGSESSSSSTKFVGPPRLPKTKSSASCAAIEFSYLGKSDSLKKVYVFAKQPQEIEFSTMWGDGVPVVDISSEPLEYNDDEGYKYYETFHKALEKLPRGAKTTRFRALMRGIPPNRSFEIMLSDYVDAELGTVGHFSTSSVALTTNTVVMVPAKPQNVEIHRTDPRLNLAKHDQSVCVDIHWSHPNMKLKSLPDDAYFRIFLKYEREDEWKFCEDEVGSKRRKCGVPLSSVTTDMPSSFATLCGLRPKRKIKITVDAFSCDGKSNSAHIEAETPPAAPSVTSSIVTEPTSQGSKAGFRPIVSIDWIPQHDKLITGHAIYLALKGIGAMKLLCWQPHDAVVGNGHLALPIRHRNFTHSEDSAILRDYISMFHVHQEQEVMISTRIVGNLESPLYVFSLGDWLVAEESVKCLNSFAADHATYVSRPIQLSFTQEQALSMYD
eukprot:TRINITY_DN30900_c0_g1_i1.p1 TRINITY_DN30900_c0_g1~~TRINITY_DN30900_c0_g1_i1.p1  ORF type:complete len:480 (+),score=74.20 TRINITY_DN30900_c0_g1_i1:85-1524(+)